MGAGILAKGFSALVGLVTIPLLLRVYGEVQYGAYITVSSVVGWLALADLGAGNALTNGLTASMAREDRKSAEEILATGFVLLSALAVLIAAVGTTLALKVDWPGLFEGSAGVPESLIRESVVWVLLGFAAGIPLQVGTKVLWAMGRGDAANALAVVQALGALLSALVADWAHLRLPTFALLQSGTQVAIGAGLCVLLFAGKRKTIRLDLSAASFRSLRAIAGTGVVFLILQAEAIAIFQTQPSVIAARIGAADVVTYTVLFRLVTLSLLPLSLLSNAVWPGYAAAHARRDWTWVSKTLKRTMLGALGYGLCVGTVFYVAASGLIALWLRGRIHPSPALVGLFAVWVALSAAFQPTTAFLNGMGRLHGQATYGAVTAAANIGLSIWLAGKWGLEGVVAALVLSYLVCAAIPQLTETFLLNRRVMEMKGS